MREKRRRRVRHRVVRVEDVEPPLARHAHEGVGQREQVLWLAEQRILGHEHALERQSRHTGAPSERQLAADEMHFVAAKRQRVRQLRGHGAASADRRVADDADSHGSDFRSDPRATGSRTTMPSAKLTPASAPNWPSRVSMSRANTGDINRVGTAAGSAGANWLR